MVLPLNSDDKLSAIALSPEKRARQTLRADYWIRTRNLLRTEFKEQLRRPPTEVPLNGATQSFGPDTVLAHGARDDDVDDTFAAEDKRRPSRVLDTGPASLL